MILLNCENVLVGCSNTTIVRLHEFFYHTGSKNRASQGRLKIEWELEALIVQLAKEN